MSFLITGGLGGLGSVVVQYLAQKTTSTLVILDNLSSPSFDPRALKSRVFFYRGDVCNEALLSTLLEKHKVDTVIDCSTRRKPENAIEAANILKSFTTLLDSVRLGSKDLRHFVLASRPQQAAEDEPLCPENFGLASLMAAEAMLHSYVISYRLPLVIARVGYLPNKQYEGTDTINVISAQGAAEGLLKTKTAKPATVFNIIGSKDWNPALKTFLPTRYNFSKAAEELEFVASEVTEFSVEEQLPIGLEKVLLYGNGLGYGKLKESLKSRGIEVEEGKTWPGRNSDKDVSDELTLIAPSHIVCISTSPLDEGKGTPCEKLKTNTYGLLFPPWQLASLCEKRGIHYTFIGMDESFSEEDVNANQMKDNQGPVKIYTERLLNHFSAALKFRMKENYTTDLSFQKMAYLILSKASGLYDVVEKGSPSQLDGSKFDGIVISNGLKSPFSIVSIKRERFGV